MVCVIFGLFSDLAFIWDNFGIILDMLYHVKCCYCTRNNYTNYMFIIQFVEF